MPEVLDGVPWTWVIIRATGVGAWLALTAVVAWGLAVRAVRAAGKPFSRALSLHRWLGTIALLLVLVHIALLLVDTYEPFTVIEILVPFVAPWRPLAVGLGTVAFWLMVPAWMLGRMRRRWGDRWFLRVHALAYAAWPLATAHYVLAGTDALALWSIALLVAGVAAIAVLLLAQAPREPVASHD
jgi:methionine sulfoxide reductase heme-binding subunit